MSVSRENVIPSGDRFIQVTCSVCILHVFYELTIILLFLNEKDTEYVKFITCQFFKNSQFNKI